MPHFVATQYDVATGAVVDTWKTLMALKAANTIGHRGRLRKLIVGGAGGAAQDVQVSLRLTRTDNTTDGTGDNDLTETKKDPDSIAANLIAKSDYSAEPTTKATNYVGEYSINSRGLLVIEWPDPVEAPVIAQNSTLCLEATPGAASAVTLNVTLEWEEF